MSKTARKTGWILTALLPAILCVMLLLPHPAVADAEETTYPISVTDTTKGITLQIDYYNDCYKEMNMPGNAIFAVDAKVGASIVGNKNRANNIKQIAYVEKQGDAFKVTATGTLNDDGQIADGNTVTTSNAPTLTLPQDGYVLMAKGNDWTSKLKQIAVGDEMSAVTFADEQMVLTDTTLKQSTYVSAVNTLIDKGTAVFTHGYFSTTKGNSYQIVTALYDFDTQTYTVADVWNKNTNASAADITVPSGGIVIVSQNTVHSGIGSMDYSYAKPVLKTTANGNMIEFAVPPPAMPARYVTDTATGKILPIYFYNDFYRDGTNATVGNIPANSIVAIDANAVPDGELKIRKGPADSMCAAVAKPQGEAYVCESGSVALTTTDEEITLTIPENGYVLLARGDARALLYTVKANDTLSAITVCAPKETDRLSFIDGATSARRNYGLDIAYPLNTLHEGAVSVFTENSTATLTEGYRYIEAKYDFVRELYAVTASNTVASAGDKTVGKASLLIVAPQAVYDKYNYATPIMRATLNGYTFAFDDYVPVLPELPQVDLTIKKGNVSIAVDGINPDSDGYVTGGKILVYTSTEMREQNAAYGSDVNKRYRVTTFARPKENAVQNVSVETIRTAAGYKHVVTEIVSSNEAVTIPYNGWLLSIPQGADGYDALAVDDELTLSGKDGAFRLPMYVVDDVTQNIRMEISGKNIEPAYSNFIVLYDGAFGAKDPEKAWRQRAVVSADGRIESTVAYGSTATATDIPANGFVLTANGAQAGCADLNLLRTGDEIRFYDIYAQTNAALSSISVGGVSVDDFQADRFIFNVYLDRDASVPEITYSTASEQATAVLTAPSSVPGDCTIAVTAPDGKTVFTYTVHLLLNKSRNVNLSQVSVGGAVWSGFDAVLAQNTYYLLKGAALPQVSAVAADAGASVTYTQATAENKQAIVSVVAEDDAYSREYVIIFEEVDLSLSSLTVGEQAIVLTDAIEYTLELPAGTEYYPIVAAQTTDISARVEITQASGSKATATVTVSNHGLQKEYTVRFTVQSTGGDNTGENNGNGTTEPKPSGCGCGSDLTGQGALSALVGAAGLIGAVLLAVRRRNKKSKGCDQ